LDWVGTARGWDPLFTLGLALLGLVIGSFLNVVIWRLPREQSIVSPRSQCPHCHRTLTWYENVPVFSWLVLRARCLGCKAPISARYPLVEGLTAAVFVACKLRFDWTPPLASALMLATLLIPLTVIDLEHWLLPFALTLPGIVIGLLLSIPLGFPRLRDATIGAVAGFSGFWFMEWAGAKLFRKEALGGGDKYLLALIGAFLSYRPLLAVVFLASFQGALIGLTLLLVRGRAGPSLGPTPAPSAAEGEEDHDAWEPGPTNIPFGPWLALGAMEVLLLGPWFERMAPMGLSWLFQV
jgi:leader peptidase (prepilin peptidase) / N-methyltransferase